MPIEDHCRSARSARSRCARASTTASGRATTPSASTRVHHEHEYNAIRNAAALIDISPLFKYLITGPGRAAARRSASSRATSTKMAVGQVIYTPWCDEHGNVIDDGTVSRLDEQMFRWTAADPSLRWFRQNARGTATSRSKTSPSRWRRSRCRGRRRRSCCARVRDADIDDLKYFRVTQRHDRAACPSTSRAPDTPGDLGYEIWMPASGRRATCGTRSWSAGEPFDIKPAGMLALDVARIEAGLLLIDVDFFSSKKALIDVAEVHAVSRWASAGSSASTRAGSSASAALAAEHAARPGAADRRARDRLDEVEALYERRRARRRRSPPTASRVAGAGLRATGGRSAGRPRPHGRRC